MERREQSVSLASPVWDSKPASTAYKCHHWVATFGSSFLIKLSLFQQLSPPVLSAVFTYLSVRCNFHCIFNFHVRTYFEIILLLAYSREFLACLCLRFCLPAFLLTSFTHVGMSVACDSSSFFYFPDLLLLIIRFSQRAMSRQCKLTISLVKDFKAMGSSSPNSEIYHFYEI